MTEIPLEAMDAAYNNPSSADGKEAVWLWHAYYIFACFYRRFLLPVALPAGV